MPWHLGAFWSFLQQRIHQRWRQLHQPLITRRQWLFDLVLITLLAGWSRWSGVANLPRGLNWDEVAYGYNAWAIRTTGMDEWGIPWPLFLRSFGEYKPALLSYWLMPWLGLTGNWNLDIRLAAATLGVASCLGVYLLVLRTSHHRWVALLTSLFLIISPWHLHYSRTVMDPIISFCLLVWGWWAWWSKRPAMQVLGAVWLVLAMWSYNSARVMVPLLAVGWLMGQWWSAPSWKKWLPARIPALLILVLGTGWIGAETLWGVGGSRARLMTDIALQASQNGHTAVDPLQHWLVYGAAVGQRYLAHFDPIWLFAAKANTIQSGLGFSRYGYLLWFLAPLIAIGLVTTRRLHRVRFGSHWWWLSWLVIAPIAGSLTSDAPHPGRALQMLPAWQYLAALGTVAVITWCRPRWRWLAVTGLLMIGLWQVAGFWTDYWRWYPSESERHFQGYYPAAMTAAEQLRWETPNSTTLITNYYDSPLLFYAWYNQLPAAAVQAGERAGFNLRSLATEPPVAISDRDQRPLCQLLHPRTVLVVGPAENTLGIEPVLTTKYLSATTTEPPAAFQLLSSRSLNPEEREKLTAECRY